jgi:hypothetical protein
MDELIAKANVAYLRSALQETDQSAMQRSGLERLLAIEEARLVAVSVRQNDGMATKKIGSSK